MSATLLEQEAPANPFHLFDQWYQAAQTAELTEPSAMTLATSDFQGIPDARMVLMRGFDERGFVFFTNYQSSKAKQLDQNPQAALVFYWAPLFRQIRITGKVNKISSEDSDLYFQSRPFGHQIGALISPQSCVIPDRLYLDQRLEERLQQLHPGAAVPRPDWWGGYRVFPQAMEFWQGRDNRLHDRLRYRRDGARWILERLAP